MTEYEITTHPDGKQFIRIDDKWMPLSEVVDGYRVATKPWGAYEPVPEHENYLQAIRPMPFDLTRM